MRRPRLVDIALVAGAALLCVAAVHTISAARVGYRIADSDRAIFSRRFAPLESRDRMGPIFVVITASRPGYRVDRVCASFHMKSVPGARSERCLIVLHRASKAPRIVASDQAVHP